MAWREVDPRHLARGAGAPARWYVESDPAVGGDLLLWLDGAGGPAEFQLTWPAPSGGREYVLNWRATGTVRAGVVDSGERTGRRKMGPLIRYSDRLPADIGPLLRAYVEARLDVLDPACREAVRAALDRLAPPNSTPAS